jgi:hypothetical protein
MCVYRSFLLIIYFIVGVLAIRFLFLMVIFFLHNVVDQLFQVAGAGGRQGDFAVRESQQRIFNFFI